MVFLMVSRGFGRLSDPDLSVFGMRVHDGITGNGAYPTPPVTMAALHTATDDFVTKCAAAADGGKMQTSEKNASRQDLLGLLSVLASYVETACGGDLATLQSSGFDARSTERSSNPLDNPSSPTVTNDGAGKLEARIDPIKNASMYEGRIMPVGGDWMDSVFTGKSQHILFTGLTEGVKYIIQVRALGGSSGFSEWSDPVTHMSL